LEWIEITEPPLEPTVQWDASSEVNQKQFKKDNQANRVPEEKWSSSMIHIIIQELYFH